MWYQSIDVSRNSVWPCWHSVWKWQMTLAIYFIKSKRHYCCRQKAASPQKSTSLHFTSRTSFITSYLLYFNFDKKLFNPYFCFLYFGRYTVWKKELKLKEFFFVYLATLGLSLPPLFYPESRYVLLCCWSGGQLTARRIRRWQSSWLFFHFGNHTLPFVWQHPFLQQLTQTRHAYHPTRVSWRCRWKIENHLCWCLNSPLTGRLGRCVLAESFHPRISRHRWTCHQYRYVLWSHHPGT